jgi:hypothetical protein
MGLLLVVLFLPAGLVKPLTVVRDAVARRLAGAPAPTELRSSDRYERSEERQIAESEAV